MLIEFSWFKKIEKEHCGMTELLLQLIKENIDRIIILFGLGLTVGMFINGSKLSSHKSRIDEAVNRNNQKYGINTKSHNMVSEDDEDASVTPDTIRKYEMEFNKSCSIHSVISQLIPIFPLMGILGTVAALMLMVNAENIDRMLESLYTALDSTLFGLLFAIGLKTIDAFFPARIIEDIDVLLEDYNKKIELVDLNNKIDTKNK